MRLRKSAAVLALGLVAGACGGRTHPGATVHPAPTTVTSVAVRPPGTTSSSTAAPARPAHVQVAGLALTPFASCPAFLDAVRSEASAEVAWYGLPSSGFAGGNRGVMPLNAGGPAAVPAAGGASPMPAAADSAAGASFSTTNNQEAGVDEADIAKSDGKLLVHLHYGDRGGQQMSVVDVASSPARPRGAITIPNGSATGLFLVGSEAVVLGATYPSQPVDSSAPPPQPQVQVWVFSLADPDHPSVARTFSVSGTQVAARLVGHSIKLVVTSSPSLVFPQPGPTPADQQSAVATNRAIIARAPLSAWLPTVTDASGHQHLADCAAVSHPAERSGVDTVSVVSIDPDQPAPGPAVTVLANPGTVYASTTALYVATTSYDEQQAISQGRSLGDARTVIHQFDIASPTEATYRGSGAVAGSLLNQFALSEYNGDLRVATTTGTPAPPPFEGGPVPAADGSQSMVTVLRPSGGALVQIGQVGGLGRTQRIYGVRFVGPQGYVVTFRQMDPLYVVDLSNPVAPAVRGALELTGYSAYLHPLGPGRLLGVGGSADANGRRTGLQVSLFDVATPAKPGLLGQSQVADGYAGVENDPHAFLWWEPTGTLVLPVGSGSFSGAIVYKVGPASITEIGRISQPAAQPPPYSQPGAVGPAAPGAAPGGGGGAGAVGPAMPVRGPGIDRAVVVGDRLYTLSSAGVLVSDLHTFAQVTWLPSA